MSTSPPLLCPDLTLSRILLTNSEVFPAILTSVKKKDFELIVVKVNLLKNPNSLTTVDSVVANRNVGTSVPF